MRYQRESRLRIRRRRRLLRRPRRAEYLPTNVRRVKLLWVRLIISPSETPLGFPQVFLRVHPAVKPFWGAG